MAGDLTGEASFLRFSPSIVKESVDDSGEVTTSSPAERRVVSEQTAAEMRNMLEMAVGDEGTAPRARIDGYRVAGKTGTARKLRDGRYVNDYVASFAGFAPVSKPRIVVAVMIDEPDAGQIYGGQVAAPVFAE